jgi:RimJ/RimL family protein N-acetyltransferase
MNNRNNKIILDGARIYLRPLHPEDVTSEYINSLNDPDVNRYLVNVRQCWQTDKTVRDYVVLNLGSSTSILFGIFVRNEPSAPLVGTVSVSTIDYFHYLASIGICLFAKRSWRKGYAHQALEMVRDYLFSECHLHYLEAGVYAENVDSIKCFLNSGFVEQYRVDNKYRHIDSFAEVIFFAAVNPLFDSSLLK